MIGTVSTDAKAEVARAHGCDHIINYSHEDVAKRVRETHQRRGRVRGLRQRGQRHLHVLAGLAQAPRPAGLRRHRLRKNPPVRPAILARKGSLYLTRPGLADYIADPAEKAELVDELFGHVAAGRIRIEINQRYALEDAVQAHRDLEGRKTTGSSIFVI